MLQCQSLVLKVLTFNVDLKLFNGGRTLVRVEGYHCSQILKQNVINHTHMIGQYGLYGICKSLTIMFLYSSGLENYFVECPPDHQLKNNTCSPARFSV